MGSLLAAAVLSFPPLNWNWSASVVQGQRRVLLAGLALAIAGAAVAAMAESGIYRLASIRSRIDVRFASMVQSPDEARSYARAADVIPDGASVLVTLVRAYLLPQGRFRILVHDQPGRAGPAPFWPANKDGRASLDYLRSQGVDFIVVGGLLTRPASCDSGARRTQWETEAEKAYCRFLMAITANAFASRAIYRDDFVTVIALRD
jgi:hypothetical protein